MEREPERDAGDDVERMDRPNQEVVRDPDTAPDDETTPAPAPEVDTDPGPEPAEDE